MGSVESAPRVDRTDEKGTGMKTFYESPEAMRAAKQGHAEACRELDNTPRHLLDEGNPNHPMYDNKIFGYNQEEFMKRQYK